MAIVDRITYALIGAFFGAILGVAGWWLYGLAHSLSYSGPGIDPVLRHWVAHAGWVFAVIGFMFRQRVADAVGDTLQALFHFEMDDRPGERASPLVHVLVVILIVAAIWFSVPS